MSRESVHPRPFQRRLIARCSPRAATSSAEGRQSRQPAERTKRNLPHGLSGGRVLCRIGVLAAVVAGHGEWKLRESRAVPGQVCCCVEGRVLFGGRAEHDGQDGVTTAVVGGSPTNGTQCSLLAGEAKIVLDAVAAETVSARQHAPAFHGALDVA